MQKFLSLLLVATALLSLSACGNKPDTESEQFPPTVYDGTGGTNGTGANGSPAPENNPGGTDPDPLAAAVGQRRRQSVGDPREPL